MNHTTLKLFIAISLVVLRLANFYAQEISCMPEDKASLERLIRNFTEASELPIGDLMVEVGQAMLGTPYVAKTLEIDGPEVLVVNFRGLDCTTFVENVLAISRILKQNSPDWASYILELERIRYRNGKLNGYASRLHYFSEWIHNNEQEGLLTDITPALGGKIMQKELNFMGTHPEFYPQLSDPEELEAIRRIEKENSKEALCVLAPEDIREAEISINNGDIIALATQINGLDVTHTGIAIKKEDNRVYLLHASSAGEVTITEQPLVDYLKGIKSNIGILVARPKAPSSN